MDELLTPTEMTQADAQAGNLEVLIAAAGWSVARAVMQHYAPCRTLVLTGPGHNGADGIAAAGHLRNSGWHVKTLPYQQATAQDTARAELVIDAVFGAGLSRDLPSSLAETLRAARRLVAVDVPSGLDGATGQIRGFAPPAELTVTFFRAKPGHYLYPGRALCGELLLRDIGLPATVLEHIAPQTCRNTPSLWALPVRAATAHKYTNGNVTVLCGPLPGAARLACAAARRAGAGMVTLAADTPMLLPESGLILRTDPLPALLQDPRRAVWICGPGLGPDAGEKLALLIAAQRTVVADADALTACAGAPEKLRGTTLITPHAGEFARLFGTTGSDKLAAARAAAELTGAVTILKGPDTIIAAPDGRAAINSNAPPWLATGGTGDVLSGIAAALLAQSMPPFEAACAAVWLHGAAAQKSGPGLLAEDLPEHLPPLMAAI
ncbi:MAG: NAD(P)H-hydrate dehydratase [Acidocella sp. 20-63-7]|nr:MAG: NAD(P)H-hydrate dehydratase [Acidocella sp. 20-63-7]HQT46670.1 NAD(P)H-hydrate dehydratase [Acidocella sp.]